MDSYAFRLPHVRDRALDWTLQDQNWKTDLGKTLQSNDVIEDFWCLWYSIQAEVILPQRWKAAFIPKMA